VPDSRVVPTGDDPAEQAVTRESVRLAFVAALQHLPPRQRAVLILRDVLRWRAKEVAYLLDTTTTAVNSILQRARAQLAEAAPSEDTVTEPTEPERRELLKRYVAAFENYDIEGIVDLFTAEGVWEMPPFLNWVRGAEKIGALIATQCPASGQGDMRLLPTEANGQPAFALYMKDHADGVHHAFGLQVLTLGARRLTHVGMFFDTRLFSAFGLPETYPSPSEAAPPSPPAAPAAPVGRAR
jgi:RNA polymerase sigma-70 factor, ECF subfamily